MDYRNLVEFDDIIFAMDAKKSSYNSEGYVVETKHEVYIYDDIYDNIKSCLKTSDYYSKYFLGEYINKTNGKIFLLYYVENFNYNTNYEDNIYYLFGYINGGIDTYTVTEDEFKRDYEEVFNKQNLDFIYGL